MKVKYANGEVSSVRNDLGRELVRAGIATVVDPKDEPASDGVVRAVNETYRLPRMGDARIPEPSWSLDLIPLKGLGDPLTKKVLCIRMDILGQTYKWFGLPKNANVQVKWNGGLRYLNGFGRPVPEEILQEYTKRWKKDESVRAPAEILNPEKSKPSGFSHVWDDIKGFVLVDS